MAEWQFPRQPLPETRACVCRERRLTELQCTPAWLFFISPLEHCASRLQQWLHQQPCHATREGHKLLALLKDSRLLFQAAVCSLRTTRDRLRWKQLEMDELNDIELFTVVLDNIYTVMREIAGWDSCRTDADLTMCLKRLDCLATRIEMLLDPAQGLGEIVHRDREAMARGEAQS